MARPRFASTGPNSAPLLLLEAQGFPIYYGLPSPNPVPTGASPVHALPVMATWRTTFSDWQVVLRPSEVAAQGLARGASIVRLSPPYPGGRTLGRFLTDVAGCRDGRVLTDDTQDDYHDVLKVEVSQFVVMAV